MQTHCKIYDSQDFLLESMATSGIHFFERASGGRPWLTTPLGNLLVLFSFMARSPLGNQALILP
jgi:hypothetical protein